MNQATQRVVDLFSGAGGMSFGFHKHDGFDVVGAVDAEMGKPSSGSGRLQCNTTYTRNMRFSPTSADLGAITAPELQDLIGKKVDVLLACPPCTGFSRTNPANHIRDDARNGLVSRSADFALELRPDVVMMENARELIAGNFRHHYESFKSKLEKEGYSVYGDIYMLTRFGLPQIRERAIVVAVKKGLPLLTLDDLWEDSHIDPEALTVRRAFSILQRTDDAAHVWPDFGTEVVRERMKSIPKDGGSWIDLIAMDREDLLTPGMRKIVNEGRIGSYPDIYGRMAWDRPAPTIKRECAHVGNGRYAHPVEDRLCSVREMATLQGFPTDYEFGGAAMSNLYRHIGDAVPPLISYQLAHLASWISTGKRPDIEEIFLPQTHLTSHDIRLEPAKVQQAV